MSTETMQWFRLYAGIVDDEKLRLLAFEDRWHYVALLALKSAWNAWATPPVPSAPDAETAVPEAHW